MHAGILLIGTLLELQGPPAVPRCETEASRRAEVITGEVIRGDTFFRSTPSGWILRLTPARDGAGWFLSVSVKGREAEDLSRLTPPWHFVPNPREIEGWHFRNAANTGPNDGSVNAPQQLREFIFSPEVGRSIDYDGSATSSENVAKVRSFGRGWLFITRYALTAPRAGERAGFESLAFTACLTSPGSFAGR
jgi:hypothetical protein